MKARDERNEHDYQCSIDFDVISIVWYVKKKENNKNYAQKDSHTDLLEVGQWSHNKLSQIALSIDFVLIIIII